MGLLEWQRQLPIKNITLCTTLEDIPEGPPCMFCGYPTNKVFVDYTCGTSVIIRAEKTAGYRCSRDCDFECPSHEALLEIFTKAREEMEVRGDIDTAKAFDDAIVLENRIIDKLG